MARLYAAWEICSIAAGSYPLSGVLPVEKQSSKERWEAAAVLFICGADHAGLHLPGDSGDPDEIPDRVLFLCMDLGSSAPDSTDRLGMYRVPVYPVERKKYPECGSHVAPGGNCDPERESGIGPDRFTADTGGTAPGGAWAAVGISPGRERRDGASSVGSEGDPGGGQGIQCRYPSRVWEKHLGCRAGKLFVRHLRDMAGGSVSVDEPSGGDR